MDLTEKPIDYFKNLRPEMLAFLPANSTHILDIGCGDGSFTESVKAKISGEAWGIEYEKDQGEKAKLKLDNVLIGGAEELISQVPDNHFDVIYCNDVLEHLANPYHVLNIAKKKLTADGVVISSIPNLRYHRALMPLLLKKDFKYKEYGVMDRTHLRFFTGKSIRRMYEDLGYTISYHQGINKSRSLKPYLYNIPLFFTALDMRYPQYGTVARVKR